MVLPIAMGVAAISRFILTKGMQKAVKKFGQKAVDRTRKSKTFKNMLENPPMTTGQKAVFGGGLAAGAVGTALIDHIYVRVIYNVADPVAGLIKLTSGKIKLNSGLIGIKN